MEQGKTLITSDDPEWITIYIYEFLNYRLTQATNHFVKIHAACGSLGGRRFMLVGDKGAGKTTLSARLLFEDIEVFGDENVLVQGSKVIPLPRTFHLTLSLFSARDLPLI